MAKIVVLHSGGLDSTTLLYEVIAGNDTPIPVGIHYGQRHAKELEAAKKITARLGLEYRIIQLPPIVKTPPPVPEGHYAEESMKATISPNRNMIMLAYAAGLAIHEGAEVVAYAAHAGDHTIYPDCRPEFVDAMRHALTVGNWEHIGIRAPFITISKADIVALGAGLGVPYGDTWSCYKGLERHCGKCGTCVERIEAFQLAGVPDPTEYM